MADQPKVFVTRDLIRAPLDRLKRSCDVTVWPGELPPSREELLRSVSGCHGLLTLLSDSIDATVMDAAGPNLKVISNYAVGYNNVAVDEARKRGIKVGNTPGVLTDATADIAVTLLLAASRLLISAERSIHAGLWKTWEPLGHLGVELRGKTLGIFGMGRIGYATARRLHHGWEMPVLYAGRSRSESAERDLAATRVSFDDLLERSDFLSVHCSLNDETKHLFGSSAFRRMKPTAVFVNTSRGPVVVQPDLADALRSGEIFAAGLDVTDPEPMAKDDPLLSLPNCVVAPHIASATSATRTAMAEIAVDNLLAGLNGTPLRHEVA